MMDGMTVALILIAVVSIFLCGVFAARQRRRRGIIDGSFSDQMYAPHGGTVRSPVTGEMVAPEGHDGEAERSRGALDGPRHVDDLLERQIHGRLRR